MINDVVTESKRRIATENIKTIKEVREAKQPVIGFSSKIEEANTGIKRFLTPRMYRHERVLATMNRAQDVLKKLFDYYSAHIDAMPPEWTRDFKDADRFGKARRIADFIAGMTDNFALSEYRRFFDSKLELR
jgi:dGTPase